MCSNYEPSSLEQLQAFLEDFLQPGLFDDYPRQAWPGYKAPFLRRTPGAPTPAAYSLELGLFGLVPHWSKDLSITRRTYNARSETAAEKPSFRDAWRKGQRCVIPARSIYEPKWTAGKSTRWQIWRKDERPLGIAGLWSAWRAPDGASVLSFSMLTVNAATHPVMNAFHRPDDEKRMVVVLPDDQLDAWLGAPVSEMPHFMKQFPADLLCAQPAPLPLRAPRRSQSTHSGEPPSEPLF